MLNTFNSFVRNHAHAIFGIALGAILTLALAVIPGCMKTGSLLTPGKMVTATQLTQEKATVQQQLTTDAAALASAVAAHNAKVTAANQQAAAADADLAQKQEIFQQIANVAGGALTAVTKGTLDPLSLLGSGIGLMSTFGLMGSMFNSSKQAGVISALRETSGPSSGPANPPTPDSSGSGAATFAAPVSLAQPQPFVVAKAA